MADTTAVSQLEWLAQIKSFISILPILTYRMLSILKLLRHLVLLKKKFTGMFLPESYPSYLTSCIYVKAKVQLRLVKPILLKFRFTYSILNLGSETSPGVRRVPARSSAML